MPLFRYVGLNKDQKQLSGVIDADSRSNAEDKLHVLGMAVLSMEEEEQSATGTKTESTSQIFEFEALDKTSKKVTGTIVAENDIAAYQRLKDEYSLFVTSLVSHDLFPEEKEAQKKKGITELEDGYQKLKAELASKQETVQNMQSVLSSERKVTKDEGAALLKINEISARIEKFIFDFNSILKPDQKTALQGYLNQLSRIKESSNIDHVIGTAKKMLLHIQEQELFVQEEKYAQDTLKIRIDSQQLLNELKMTSTLNKPIDIEKTISESRFLRPLARILNLLPDSSDPKLKELYDQLKSVNNQIIAYLKIALFGSAKHEKSEAWKILSSLRTERNRIKENISALKEKLKSEQKDGSLHEISILAEQILGWVLGVYIVYYVVSYVISVKKLPLPFTLNPSFAFYNTVMLKTMTVFCFIAYCALFARNRWLKQKPFVAFILYLFTITSFLLILINLI